MDIPYEDSLQHTKWVNGILYLIECNPEEDAKLIQTNVSMMTVIAAITLENYLDVPAAMLYSMATTLRIGYYLGQNGIGADAPTMSPEYVKKVLEPIITPNCDCTSCQAKIDVLKEYGIEYEMTPERQEVADEIEEKKQVRKMVEDALPPDDFNPCVN